MALKLDVCEDKDMARFFEIVSDSFGLEHEYINVMFPDHNTPAGRVKGAERFLQIKKTVPYSTFLKVTDTANGEIIGVAKWDIYNGYVPPEGGLGTTEWWDNDDTARYVDALYQDYLIERRKALRETGGHLASLDILCVDPKHHYRGAGRILVDWGTKKADEMGTMAIVEASVYGRHLYETSGFQMIKFITVELPEPWTERPRQRFFWMVRPKPSAKSIS